MTDFLDVSELAGDDVTREQVERIFHRYAWAASFCRGKDVLEAACGTGQGLGMLAGVAKKVVAGDFSEAMVRRSKAHYGDRLEILRFDAQALPFVNASFFLWLFAFFCGNVPLMRSQPCVACCDQF